MAETIHPLQLETAEPLVIGLAAHVEHEGGRVIELNLREPLVGEVRRSTAHAGARSTIVGVAEIAGVPEAVVRRIGVRDITAAERYLRDFIDWSPPEFADGLPPELVITLPRPVTFAGVTTEKLVLREPTAGELEQFENLPGIDSSVRAVQLVAGIPEKVVDQLPIRVLNYAAEYLMGFLT